MTTVYLAGKMIGLTMEEMAGWRIHAKTLLGNDFQTLDPVETELTKGATSRAIVDINKFQIRHSDVLLVELNHEAVSIGTIGEIVFAREHGKPIIVWGTAENIINHPWVKDHITVCFSSLYMASQYIKDNYLKYDRRR